ncbi:SDR family oxidoreductase [Aliivibrio sifiae]
MKKTVLITGGNKGIGLEVTRYFLNKNFRIIVIARDLDNFYFRDHTDVEALTYNLENTQDIPNLIAGIGNIDVLINNAGIMLSLPFNDYSQKNINKILKINIESPVALINEVSKGMIKNKRGRIVNNASIAGQVGHPDVWYGITKSGLINATKSFSKILGPHGIMVNAVAPSPVDTDMLDAIPIQRKEQFKEATITQRFAKAEEVANVIGWLGTNSPEYINGICIDINNGAFPR